MLDQLIAMSQNLEELTDKESAIKMGFQFIYLFRKFITQQEMIFSYACTYTDENGVASYGSYEVPLNDILNALLIHTNKDGKMIIKFERNLREYQAQKDNNFSDFYKHLVHMGINLTRDDKGLDWQESRDIMVPNHKVGYIHKQNDTGAMYVYSPESETNTRPQRVYYYEERKRYQYNEGWLYEWAKKIYDNRGNNSIYQSFIEQVVAEQPNHLLRTLFTLSEGRDQNWGSRMGDYQRIVEGRLQQVQAKNRNKELIAASQVWAMLERIRKEFLIPFQQAINATTEKSYAALGNNKALHQQAIETLYGEYNTAITNTFETLLQPITQKKNS